MAVDPAYLRYPNICGDTVVFVCEDDLWLVPATGGRAWRLTAGVADTLHPRFSPDGAQIAFVGREEGPYEVYVVPAAGGSARRLTWQAASCRVLGWSADGARILYSSNAERPFRREEWLWTVPAAGGIPESLPLGPASGVACGPGKAMLLGRNTGDPARWKRYRGGTAGELWVDANGDGEFQRLSFRSGTETVNGNFASPCWVGERIYFLSDHEGIGNVYSCRPDGTDLRRHSDHEDFYARNLSTDGQRLVYHMGGDLYVLDGGDASSRRLDVHLGSSSTQRNRRFVAADRYLHNASLSADGGALAVTTRGKAYSMHNWEGAVTQHGEPDGVRYRLLHYLNDGKRMVAAASDEGPGERLVLLDQKGQREIPVDLGRIVNLEPAPVGGRVALSNHRNEVWVVDLDRKKIKPTLVDKSPYDRIAGLGWSPDGNWLAYGYPQTAQTTCIKLWDGKSSHVATQPVLHDMRPAFDPDGKYLYFIGQRDFNPVYDAVQFDLGFPRASRPFLIPLRRDLASPFIPQPKTPEPPADDKKKKKKSGPELTRIDLDGIADRVVGFPLSEARYGRVLGVKGGKVLWSVFPLEGGRVSFWDTAPPAKGTIEQYDFEKNKQEPFVEGISDFTVARDGKTLLYRAGRRLRVVKATEKPEKSKDGDEGTKFSRLTGWVDLGRIRVSVRPAAEWRQMFREAWRLQREHFWVEDMYGIDWDEVYARYRPLVDRIATRHEFSDLLWELQGELGTSHAYEMGGEYRQSPHYRQGSLGVEFERDKKSGLFRIARILQGDPWDPPVTSPFNTPGANVAVGEVVLAINGLPVGGDVQPAERLVNQAGLEVAVTLRGKGGATRTVTVKALADERAARYREWVDLQRRIVHEKTGGRVGYVHIPDMGPEGYSQFHRGFLVEYDRDALIVDVRHNGGGHVSSLLLQKLARRRLGYDFPRWGMPVPYPMESPGGPLVALTNEHAGSDGDMFSHAFKMLKLGPLIGKRTWGGVVGISPRHTLADGTITTQPEFSFWFDDVGWRLENYGTEPDVEVDNAPQDYRRGKDPQLERAIAVALDLLKERPPHRPERMPHNRFVRPRLGPRPQGQPAKKRKR